MLRSVVLVLAAAAAATARLPGVARADDAALAGTVTAWSVTANLFVTAKVNRAARLAKDGAALLTRAGTILTTLS